MLLALLLAHGGALGAFEATLAAQDSATAALGQWCAARHLADPAAITAAQVKGADAVPPPDLDETLRLGEGQEAGYRHVRLSCGGKVLSQAHNWYAPARLTPAMNQTLNTTDTPFGKVAAPLGFRRERLGAVEGAAPGCPRDTVLSHRALLRLPDGAPLALVVECYTPAIMGK
jgi:chorismate-pyruvate lyase